MRPLIGEVVERYNILRRMVQEGRRFESLPSPLGFVVPRVYSYTCGVLKNILDSAIND